MNQTYSVHCPNCGELAIRSNFTKQKNQTPITKTECPSCDYLMVTCSESGNVIEAYTSSTSSMSKDKDRVQATRGNLLVQSLSNKNYGNLIPFFK